MVLVRAMGGRLAGQHMQRSELDVSGGKALARAGSIYVSKYLQYTQRQGNSTGRPLIFFRQMKQMEPGEIGRSGWRAGLRTRSK